MNLLDKVRSTKSNIIGVKDKIVHKFHKEYITERIPFTLYDTENVSDIEKYFGKEGEVTMHIVANDTVHWKTRLIINGKCIGELNSKTAFDRLFYAKAQGKFKGLKYSICEGSLIINAKFAKE